MDKIKNKHWIAYKKQIMYEEHISYKGQVSSI